MESQYRKATADRDRRVKSLKNPSTVHMHKIHSDTAQINRERLLRWKEDMEYHEMQTKDPRERVYLVVSDLHLLAISENYTGQGKWHSAHRDQPSNVFLHTRDIDSLHGSHWAVEIDRKYYELDRLHGNRSKFSSNRRVEDHDRQILARIFIGTSHLGRSALEAIGDAVIRTQLNYQLTRDNCHRFVNVFSTLILCPNHVKHTTGLPFDAEQQLKTRELNQRTGISGTKVGKMKGEEKYFPRENYTYRASSQIGEGVEWVLLANGPYLELRRTLRQLTQRTKSVEEPNPLYNPGNHEPGYSIPQYTYETVYLNEFDVEQDETSYFMTVNLDVAKGLYMCHHLDANPYMSLARFEKQSYYAITQKYFKGHYKPMGTANGKVSFPYGVIWINGIRKDLEPTTLIRDRYGVLRKANGDRMEVPKSTWRALVADFEDFFGTTNESSFAYSLPTWDLVVLMSKQQIVKQAFPWVLIGGAGLSAMSSTLKTSFRKLSRKSTKGGSSEKL